MTVPDGGGGGGGGDRGAWDDRDGDDPNRRRWQDAAEHVAAYRASDGAVGHTWQDRPHLLLTTTGRRSGRAHTVPLVHARLTEDPASPLVVVASAGGAERHPAWYLNLEADPDVHVQLRARRWSTSARRAEGEDEESGWRAMVRTWSGFAAYREGTARRIPVVLLDVPPGGTADGPG